MADTQAKLAFGTTLMRVDVPIAELTNIGGPSLSADTIDATSHDSLVIASGYREFIQGLRNGGEISIEGNFIPANPGQVALKTDFDDGSLVAYTITFPAVMATTWTFSAIVTALETSSPFDDKASFTATLKVSGKPSLNVTASAGMSALTGNSYPTEAALVFVPTFAIGTFFYTCDVVSTKTYVRLSPTATGHTITINGSIVTTETESGDITLGDEGTNTKITIIVWQAGKAKKTYIVWVTRAA